MTATATSSRVRAAAWSGCRAKIWRKSADATLAARLAQSGPLPVSGLQGVGAWQDRPRNAPPVESYFVSYADGPPRRRGARAYGRYRHPEGLRGGFARRPRAAGRASAGGPPPPPDLVAPPTQLGRRSFRRKSAIRRRLRRARASRTKCAASRPGAAGQAARRPDVQIGGRCCPVATLVANAECSNSACPAGQTAIGPSNFCCDSSHVYTGSGNAPACCAGFVVNGQCEPPKPPACPPGGPVTAQCPCPSGYITAGGSCCLASNVTSTGVCCPPGQAPGLPSKKACVPIPRIPIGHLCCAAGHIPTARAARAARPPT